MQLRVAAIIVGLLAAGAPALAIDSGTHQPTAKKARVAALPPAGAPVSGQRGTVRHRKGIRMLDRRKKAREAGQLTTPEGDPLPTTINFPADAVGWRLIEDTATGVRLGLPEKLVPYARASRTGSRWTSAQGQIQVETFRLSEAALPALFEEEKKASRRRVASSELKPDSFVIIGVQRLKNFLIRAEARGSEVRGMTVLYDQATEGTMDRVAAAMLNAFAGFPDPNAAPVPGLQRAVEYGSAIVMSSDGDLIASAHVTDDCQSITVPPFGHAERVAADTANDLALIRLYGARNLVPATLAADSGRTDDLKLMGVADPLAQEGGAEVSSATARLTAQGIEPAPKPGFAGAAAVDAHGTLAGMVDLKPSVVAAGMLDLKSSVAAGNSPVSLAAMLVPAAAIRAFLEAQHISPAAAAAGHASVDQSVMRLICVRK